MTEELGNSQSCANCVYWSAWPDLVVSLEQEVVSVTG